MMYPGPDVSESASATSRLDSSSPENILQLSKPMATWQRHSSRFLMEKLYIAFIPGGTIWSFDLQRKLVTSKGEGLILQ